MYILGSTDLFCRCCNYSLSFGIIHPSHCLYRFCQTENNELEAAARDDVRNYVEKCKRRDRMSLVGRAKEVRLKQGPPLVLSLYKNPILTLPV